MLIMFKIKLKYMKTTNNNYICNKIEIKGY